MPARVPTVFLLASLAVHAESLSLAGSWRFRLDPEQAGLALRWFAQRMDGDSIFLPGSTDQAGYGLKTAGPSRGWLSRPWIYEGPAWYQRDVVIPEAWRGRRIALLLERPHWHSQVWVDDQALGSQDSLSVAHVYDLTSALSPGRRRLTICVDNTYRIEVGRNAHSVTDHTQTNWNGIVGRIELEASDPVWVDSVAIHPNVAGKTLRIEAVIGNLAGKSVSGEVAASTGGDSGAPVTAKFSASGAEEKVALTIPFGGRLWDEYEPALEELTVSVSAGPYRDQWQGAFGVRQIGTRNKQFVLNGRPTFLRGTLECNIFPLTGYPPMTVGGWGRLFRIARSYGLNHFRFHSWCPPEAAFAAADRAGFLLHVELPVWSNKVGRDKVLDEFMRAEARRILKAYGNHPSFTMLCLGNELTGDFAFMDELVAELKRADPRRLYTFSADHVRRVPGPTSDYYVTHSSAAGRLRIHGTRFGATAGGTDYDFSTAVERTPVPLVAHELGQWAVYPSYEEIAKYTGVLKPRNLEAFREQLAERGMGDQAKAFQAATGRFSWLVYKEDIETALRTPNLGGVQLLQLQDFPGQGEALIGLLDSFWDSKGIYEPAEFRQFFSQTVPLLRFPKFVWTNDETFRATAQVTHYGKQALDGAVGEWSVQDDAGRVVGSGRFPAAEIALGSVTTLGEIELPLAEVRGASRLRVTLRLAGAEARNHWDIWVYPKAAPAEPAGGAMVARALDEAARKKLAEGGKVLLIAPAAQMKMQFLPVFWSLSWFPKQPGTMGILCDPGNPALAGFPTDRHSNWQWWELTEGAPVFVLDETPPGFRPIVQVIDDFHRNHKLGAVFETRAGKGKLLVSSFDLASGMDQRPVARQLLHSLLSYMSSARFEPQVELDAALLDRLLQESRQ
jgi:hypothetical protein